MKKVNWSIVTLVLLGSLSWSITMVKSGFPTKWGIGFWGANGHDGIWHLALIESIKHGFPIQNPLASGTVLTNYHWGFDYLVSTISAITNQPPSLFYFQILPPLMAFLIGTLTYLFVRDWTKSKAAGLWAAFFTYFGGSFGWVVTYLRTREIAGESLFWSQQAVSTLINPPYALSLVVLIYGFWLIVRNPRPNIKQLLLQILVFSPLFIIKSYSAVIALVGLFTVGTYQLFKEKEIVGLVRALLVGGITTIIILTSFKGANDLIQFEPLWFTHSMVEAGDRLNLSKFVLARQAYSAYHMYHRLIPLEALLIAIFLLGNFGTRILGIFTVLDFKKQKSNSMFLAVTAMLITAIILPTLFTQKGTTWNTIQFFYYAQVFLGWQAAIWLGRLKLNKPPIAILAFSTILLTIPTTISTLTQNYIPPRPPATLPFQEQEALNFLRDQPDGVVLSYPYIKPTTSIEPPIPLAIYDTTAYISAYSGKPTYLSDTVNLSILNFQWNQRQVDSLAFFSPGQVAAKRKFLTDNNISYLYLAPGQNPPTFLKSIGLIRIFHKGDVSIYKNP